MNIGELIAALEKAEGPSRELDAEVGRASGWVVLSSFTGGGYREAPPGEIDCKPLPFFTASLDDALEAAEAREKRMRELLAIYVHAHKSGNSVPPNIDGDARKALAETAP